MTARRFIVWARVSSEEQAKGFSLSVQEETAQQYVCKQGGEVVRVFSVAETASKKDERTTFNEMISFAKEKRVDAILFYSVDRAARNLHDLAALETLKDDHGIQSIFVSQGIDGATPEGEMMSGILGVYARHQTRLMSGKIRTAMKRRAEEGLFVAQPPLGYQSVPGPNGRAIAITHPEDAVKVKMIFELYAFESYTVEGLIPVLLKLGIGFRREQPRFTKNGLHKILRNKSYLGLVPYAGNWYPGKHDALIDLRTFERVQQKLAGKVQRQHQHLYASKLIRCECGRWVTGEEHRKANGKTFLYYRCTGWRSHRETAKFVPEASIDQQVLALFERLRVANVEVIEWFKTVLRAQSDQAQQEQRERRSHLQAAITKLNDRKSALLDLLMDGTIDKARYDAKHDELRKREADLVIQLGEAGRDHSEVNDLAAKAIELSQHLQDKWVGGDYAAKRRILEIVGLNYTLRGATLDVSIRKPFDVLAEGLAVHSSTP